MIAIRKETQKYSFNDVLAGDSAAGQFYEKANGEGLGTLIQNIAGNAHQKYLVFANGERREPGKEIASLEYNGTIEPAIITLDAGTSRHREKFKEWAASAAQEFGGQLATQIDGP